MGRYSLDELENGFQDLLTHKQPLLALLPMAADLRRGIEEGLARILGLGTGGKVANQTVLADRHHDTLLRFIRRALESYLHHPNLTESAGQRIERLLQFVPPYTLSQKSYDEEVATARELARRLPQFQADLQAVPLLDGQTLLEAFQAYLDAAEALDASTRQQGESHAAAGSRKEAVHVLASLVGLLNDMRESVTLAVRLNPELPRDLPQQLFSYFDEIDRRRDQRRKPPEKPADVGTVATPAA